MERKEQSGVESALQQLLQEHAGFFSRVIGPGGRLRVQSGGAGLRASLPRKRPR